MFAIRAIEVEFGDFDHRSTVSFRNYDDWAIEVKTGDEWTVFRSRVDHWDTRRIEMIKERPNISPDTREAYHQARTESIISRIWHFLTELPNFEEFNEYEHKVLKKIVETLL